MEKKVFVRRSLTLTEKQWSRLEELARIYETFAPTGTGAGQPSWRTLIKELATESSQFRVTYIPFENRGNR